MSVGSLFDTSSPIIETSDKASYVHEVKTLYSEGSYWDIREADDTIQDPKFMQLKSMLGDNMGWLFVMILFIEVPYFTLGICLSKYKWFEKRIKINTFQNGFIYLIPVWILGKSSYLWLSNENAAESIAMIFGISLAISFICLFKYLYQTYQQNIIFRGFESLGKMSLSMYILQSIIGTLILYGYGLGFFGKDVLLVTTISFIFNLCITNAFSNMVSKALAIWSARIYTSNVLHWKIKVGKRR